MKIESSVYKSNIANLKPGDVFAVDLNDVVTYCMAIEPQGRETIPGLIAIYPGHPMTRGKPGVFNGTVVSESPLLVFPSAMVVPSPNPDHLKFTRFGQGVPVGSLLVFDKSMAISAFTEHNRSAAFDCIDGNQRHRVSSAEVCFTSWEIMIEGPGGELHTLCVVNVSSS